MYAIFEDGSHQYMVGKGDTVDVQLHELEEDQKAVDFDKVLVVRDGDNVKIGQPYVEGAKVSATILDPRIKGDKIDMVKYRRRKNSRVHKGHRQKYLRVRIDNITA